MSLPVCGASAFLHAQGPAAVPFRLCCALAIVTGSGSGVSGSGGSGADPSTFVCTAADPCPALLLPEPDFDSPAIGEAGAAVR